MRHWWLIAMLGVVVGCTPPASSLATQGVSWKQVSLTAFAYNGEAQDAGVPPTNAIRVSDYEAPSPTIITGATTITTPQLRDMMLTASPPAMIDVLDGSQTVTLPGAVFAPRDGFGGQANQQRLAADLTKLTAGDKTKPLVFFCLSQTCWLSHNAAVGAVALGYTNVYWYRGGRRAWQAAGLPLEAIKFTF